MSNDNNNDASNYSNQNFKQKTYRNLLSNNPVVQMIKNLAHEGSATIRKCEPSTSPACSISINEQDAATKARLYQVYGKENIYKANANFVGFGISSDLKLRKNEIVGVIKKSDPCGNDFNWFVDNGIVKGIIPSSILQHFDTIDIKNQRDFNNPLNKHKPKERHHSVTSHDSFEEDDSNQKQQYVNQNVTKAEVCD